VRSQAPIGVGIAAYHKRKRDFTLVYLPHDWRSISGMMLAFLMICPLKFAGGSFGSAIRLFSVQANHGCAPGWCGAAS
jgi:hypothetical protein